MPMMQSLSEYGKALQQAMIHFPLCNPHIWDCCKRHSIHWSIYALLWHVQVISFNMGSLGFLTNHDFKGMHEDLNEVIFGSKEGLEQCSIDGSVSCCLLVTMFVSSCS